MNVTGLDSERIRQIFDLRQVGDAKVDGQVFSYTEDPYPAFHCLREAGPVHESTMHELLGWDKPAPAFEGLPEPDRPHFTVFDYEHCGRVLRDEDDFPSSPEPIDPMAGLGQATSMLAMNGRQHRRYRALVQPSFVPQKAKWWIARWIQQTVHVLIDGFESDGRAELNVDFDAAIPVLTITGSFGFTVEQAMDVKVSLARGYPGVETLQRFLMPIIERRRDQTEDDLISVLVEAEMSDEDGTRHSLSDAEIFSFSHLLLLAGSGTTWKQLGITLAALLTRPDVLDAVRRDRSLLRAVIEESMRWCPTDPTFARYTSKDLELAGVKIPRGAVVHVCLAAANRDPARWDRPDEYDPGRTVLPHIGFGGGPHLCLGQHLARAEIHTAIDALLTRLPNLRLDPDAEAPKFIGLYERGATEINVVWD